MATARIVQLAHSILTNVSKVDESMKRAHLPELSLGIEASPQPSIPSHDGEAQMAKNVAISAATELTALLLGPNGAVQSLAAQEYDIAVLHVIHRFKLAQAVPLHGTSTFEAIAKHAGLSSSKTKRVLRYAMTNNIFTEPRPGVVAHSAISRALLQDVGVIAEAGQLTDEQFGAAAHMVEGIQKYGDSEEPTHAGWALANRASKPMFEELRDKHPNRASQFGAFMDLWATQHPAKPLIEDYAWSTLPVTAHIVDIGGGEGNVSVALAQAFPSFQFTVQDLTDSITRGPGKIPTQLKERIHFQEHNFMTVQSVKGADVYFFRSVFHDWPDDYCVKILANLVPALKPGARIILNELCTDHAGLAPPIQRIVRGLDLVMMSLFNGRERGEEDFAEIFRRADSRFKFLGGRQPAVNEMGIPVKGLLSIMEAKWDP